MTDEEPITHALPWEHPHNVRRRQLEWDLHMAEDDCDTDRCVVLFGRLHPELAPDEVEACWRKDFVRRFPLY